MGEREKTILIDVDGTVFDDFAKEDKKIIYEIFNRNIFVVFLDYILQKVNSLGLFTNSMIILKLRLLVYSILSFRNYNRVLMMYRMLYIEALNRKYISYYSVLQNLSSKYNIIFITNNEFTLYSKMTLRFICKYASNYNQRRIVVKEILKSENAIILIGNNYVDDFKVALKNGLEFVYVGTSPIFRKIVKEENYFIDFVSVYNFLKNSKSKD